MLKKGTGKLLISTPNALTYTTLFKIIKAENFFPPYIGYSHYARHNRLFTTNELLYLLSKIGYEIHFCYSVYDHSYFHINFLDKFIKLLIKFGKLRSRLDVIYVFATPVGEPKFAYPNFPPFEIFSDTQAYHRITSSHLNMADEMNSQLMDGFYPLELWGQVGVRWTTRRAILKLRCSHQNLERTLSFTFYSGSSKYRDEASGKIWVGDSLHLFKAPSETWQTLTFPVISPSSAELLIIIEIENPFIPNSIDGSNDTRELGIALKEIGIT